ncbi:hypothetical protein ABKA04_007198 [Annulohypoxylon sp. FPYF3050]
MAPTSHGRAGPNGRDNFTNGSLNSNNNGPPPSTLAAQLVENISASTRSSRPDETAELKRFFGIIEEVKNQPGILKTSKERMEHNHMLIYVYTRVVLESLRWDDPFADKVQLRADASRAIDFLKITIGETPDVLSAKSEAVLKMLGSGYCADLKGEIEQFFREIFLITSRIGVQWPLIPQFLAYFKSSFDAIINYFKGLKAPSTNRDVPVQLQLPPDWILTSVTGDDSRLLQQQCTYEIASASHALHHATGLLSIMAMPLLHHSPEFDIVSSFQEYIPWLFDAYFHLHGTQAQWQYLLPSVLSLFLQNSLQFLDAFEIASSIDGCVEQKVSTLLVLICMEISSQRLGALITHGQDNVDYRLLCLSLAKVARACTLSKPISRLVTSQLIPTLEKSIIGSEADLTETDFWRCLELLRRVAIDPVPTSLDVATQADKFSDERLRHLVDALDMGSSDAADAERQSKRRKVSTELFSLRTVTARLKSLLGLEPTTNLADVKAALDVLLDDQLNLVLVKLVEYLGSDSITTSAAAFVEIVNLARSRGMTARRFFEPFWRYLAFSATKDLTSRPKLTRLLAELLDMSVAELLLYVQKYALPWLVLTKKRDVIQKIAEARNEEEIWRPCLDEANLGPILALLLTQETPDIQEYCMDLLKYISPHLSESGGLLELLRIEPIGTTLELLKAAGDADEDRKGHIRGVLNKVASMMLAGSGELKSKKVHASGPFLQRYALALMAGLTQVINDVSSRTPSQERRRYIKAMEEMIRTGKHYIRVARPQISACLQAAMLYDDLRSAAFSCWAAMLLYLEDVEALIETTFFLISHYWSSFDETTQKKSKDLIESLLDKESTVLEATISKLPSFSHINYLSDIEGKLSKLRQPVDSRTAFSLLAERVSHENDGVVLLALRELASYLQRQQGYLQASAVSEQPDSVVSTLARSLLDCSSRFNGVHSEISDLCTQCLGLVGCLDPNRVETVRAERQIVVKSNFEHSGETTDFVIYLLEEVLVKSFLSATDTKLQGFLSYAMQELLERADIKVAVQMEGTRDAAPIYRKWLSMSVTAREVLIPFLTSRYVVQPMAPQQTEYPIFRPGKTRYANWMRSFTLDLMRKPQAPFAELIFEPLCRVVRIKDLSTVEFLFPYVILHIVVGEDTTEEQRSNVLNELLNVLRHEVPANASYEERENQKLYCEAVFRFIDYGMRWLQLKRAGGNLGPRDVAAMDLLQGLLDSIPAELISQRAVDCKAYARALFHLERHIRQVDEEKKGTNERDRLLQRLQDIYSQIDEPDGLEGISAHLHVLDVNQQVLSHRKAGRWAAAQTWYEIKLAEDPDNVDIQIDLLTCLKESGQHDVLLNYVEGIEKHTAVATINRIVPYAVEASWATGRWRTMEKFITKYQGDRTENFNVSIAQALLYLRKGWTKAFVDEMKILRDRVNASMNFSITSSLQACHEPMLKCHVLTDLELIAGINNDGNQHPQEVLKTLDRRLEVLGSYVNDKQFVLSIRRAAMELMRFGDLDISALWLSSARLARKTNSMHQSFNAVLHASQLGDDSATIENARLLWKEGHNRKAIQTLKSAIESKAFTTQSFTEHESSEKNLESQQNMLTARAQLLLAKWLDNAGQTHATALREHYRSVPKNYGTWEKGHYYLGRHYKKVLESERTLKPDDQSDEYLTGETAKLVIENYMRSLNYGVKYLYQTLPRILTLWLELGAQVDKAPEGKISLSKELHHRRKTQLSSLHKYLNKSIFRLPAYIFYTALPQLVARIAHPNMEVFMLLEEIILKVVEAHPRQALWSLFAVTTSRQTNTDRRVRGQRLMQKIRDRSKKVESGSLELKTLLRMGEKLAEQLLLACSNGDFQSNRTTVASITRDLNFNHKCTPCPLVVPIEICLTATLPTLTDNVKKHKAFSRDVILVQSFLDEVLVLGSLAKPRKLTARGSNGVNYGLLIKPKDDLRTDQRLMEFNGMINRSLKRDAESSRRQLYIKTYAVTPLNEECGIIEWVDGLKTLRDILLNIYRSRGIMPNYQHLAQMMKDAASGDSNTAIFTERVLGMFPPVLPNWFIAQFPNPSAWFAARLRYTRSCAVMSMVGTILGLGDRHGENVLLEEGNGGVFHVDFNCLFDKGLTFAQPERVPFRLTHNMVAAMGIYGYEGPFRQCSELTLSILRQQEETLMTILEAFIYDPTLDLQKDKRRKNEVVKLNPQSVVDSIKRKVRGLLPDESIPLGVEGQVEELIKQAVNPKNLTAMYIGWCPFL